MLALLEHETPLFTTTEAESLRSRDSSFFPQIVNKFRGFRFRFGLRHRLMGLFGEGLEIRLLGARHRVVTGNPVLGVFLSIVGHENLLSIPTQDSTIRSLFVL